MDFQVKPSGGAQLVWSTNVENFAHICIHGLMNKSLTDDRLEARQVQRVSAGIEERAPT